MLVEMQTRKTEVHTRTSSHPPGEHEVGTRVAGSGPSGAPLDGVDLLAVRLQVVHTQVLLHAPDLQTKTQTSRSAPELTHRHVT